MSRQDSVQGSSPPIRLLLIVLLFGLVLRLGISSRDITTLDRLFIPDDTYYTLSIARSLAEGEGPSVDGQTTTNGFQPLIAFLEVPLFWISDGPDTPLRAIMVALALADVLAAFLLALLARRLAGWEGAIVAASVWMVSPVAIKNALGGLETTLALAICLGTVEAWCRAAERDRIRGYALAGGLCGLALLARVDSAFLVAALGVLELGRGRVRQVASAASVAAIVVAPWWLYSTVHHGSPVPESGAAVIQLVEGHQDLYLTVPMQMGWAAGTLLGPPFMDSVGLRSALLGMSMPSVIAWLLGMGLLVAGSARFIRSDSNAITYPIWAFAVHGLVTCIFYTFMVPALWFFRRYMVGAEALATLLLVAVLVHAWRARERSRPLAWAGLAVGVSFSVVALGTSLRYLWIEPAGTLDVGLHGAAGYREPAQEVLALVPPGATLGALQSGALSYFAGPDQTVVNLDGVVDKGAKAAFGERRLSDYARERGVGYLADWQFNLREFTRTSERSDSMPKARQVGVGRPQGRDQFIVLELEWPPLERD